ncbi:3-hydroxyacyl-CoA dehydrogenase NAD-binding domain-containing protein [Hymenobacter cellulosilyticus]|uniref:3-hydroxyacyl-CoA dehydrogenase NAD-binding domain-containing protein n=1 Tax=Hymenobacter cellulosilyticus TaxID=2932248 RepID=A0A8T9QFF7_9BACT|nr:3-hydroxyacyl-CoA dehydrogenase NAD-binding domain-containing protein [Hymenobacter cellulosilyticus]UOQ74550.1 3-hydroxyacyl-CoA dehydrogenase NAD-binding domain-containing protein [Hymenobacter cellulosilyticus]
MIIGIIGSGAMGAGIAQVVATAGHMVRLLDQNRQALDRAGNSIQGSLDKLTEKGKLTAETSADIFSRLHLTQDIDAFNDCELVLEAIVEDLAVKQQLFREVEMLVPDTCILASNTSSLSIASIAAACQKPERFIGIHFFNPAPVMQLVEVIPAVQTREGLAEEVRDLVQSWGKLPVLTKDTPGFIVNRVARPFYGEAIRILEEGIADMSTIDWALTELGGFRMGPFTLMDFIGHDVNYRVTESVFTAFFFDPRFKPSFTQKRLFEAGYYGRKSGRGFYNYAEGAVQPEPNRDETLGRSIVNRVLAMLINEAVDALAFNVASKEDLELAMTKGVNYPKGLLAWADELGLENVLKTLDELYAEYHEDRYRASALLRRMVRQNQTFFQHESALSR